MIAYDNRMHPIHAWPAILTSDGRGGLMLFPFCQGNCHGRHTDDGALFVAHWSDVLLLIRTPANDSAFTDSLLFGDREASA